VMAVRSASPIHYLQMNAAGQKFWLGGQTSSYCPTQVGQNCPPGNQTVLAPGGNSLVRNPNGSRLPVCLRVSPQRTKEGLINIKKAVPILTTTYRTS
jgi:hypothetical protein